MSVYKMTATQIAPNEFFDMHQPIPSQPFLGYPIDFKTFSHALAILNRTALFLQPE